jgi:hypothetical protein
MLAVRYIYFSTVLSVLRPVRQADHLHLLCRYHNVRAFSDRSYGPHINHLCSNSYSLFLSTSLISISRAHFKTSSNDYEHTFYTDQGSKLEWRLRLET